MIKFIVEIKESTGELVRITFPQRDLPKEGMLSEDIRVVYVTEETLPSPECNNLRHFINEYWYIDQAFVKLGKKPNKHAKWNNSTGSWTWDIELFLEDVRQLRRGRLLSCDWTQMPDSPLTAEQKTAWATYRQALRDFPSTIDPSTASLEDLVWPTSP
jgi:hypothetical protein